MSTTRPSPPATKRDVIVEELRRLILSGELSRGERLRQDDLAARFSASITPVREALRALEAEGLAVSAPHRGVRVAGIDLERVTATYVVRRLTESYAVARATTRLSLRDLGRVEALVEEVAVTADPARRRAANRELHFLLYERCGLPGLVAQIQSLWAAFPWDVSLGSEERARASDAEHRRILEALRAGDPEAARVAAEDHIRHGFADLQERLTGAAGPDPFELDAD